MMHGLIEKLLSGFGMPMQIMAFGARGRKVSVATKLAAVD